MNSFSQFNRQSPLKVPENLSKTISASWNNQRFTERIITILSTYRKATFRLLSMSE